MKSEEHDALWDLLGKARPPQPSPFFSRNVLRAIRQEKEKQPSRFTWLVRGWKFLAVGAAAVLVAVFSLDQISQPDPVTLLAQEVSSSPDYQVISHLDELLASEESSVWLDNSAN